MKKKVFTLALLAVFVLAQFSMASATSIAGATVTIDPLPTFSQGTVQHELVWSVTGMPATGSQYVNFWYRILPNTTWSCIGPGPVNVTTLTNANGTFLTVAVPSSDQDVIEFLATVDDMGCPASPSSSTPAMASTFTDTARPYFSKGNPPYIDSDSLNYNNPVSCNTFEMWALGSDYLYSASMYGPDAGYSGFKAWNPTTTGTFAPPVPEGPDNLMLSWIFTFPSTASGGWTFSLTPEDYAGNDYYTSFLRNNFAIAPAELEDCENFTDVAGHADEVYIRYLADLGLISGFADGTFGPDNTLTRAEAATLFEKANGWADETGLPDTAPSAACTFTDVSASDWFSGWVWQACADGFMNGVGGGLFDPNNLLTRGQIVTIFNNIANTPDAGAVGSYLEDNTTGPDTILNYTWNEIFADYGRAWREAAWTDVYVGDYYAAPIMHAYGFGVADATGPNTFSPNQPVLRGEFAKMYYRALGRTN